MRARRLKSQSKSAVIRKPLNRFAGPTIGAGGSRSRKCRPLAAGRMALTACTPCAYAQGAHVQRAPALTPQRSRDRCVGQEAVGMLKRLPAMVYALWQGTRTGDGTRVWTRGSAYATLNPSSERPFRFGELRITRQRRSWRPWRRRAPPCRPRAARRAPPRSAA